MRKFVIEFPCIGKQAIGTLREDNKVAADGFWEWMETPQKCFLHPTISTGDWASAYPRPPRENPDNVGDQTTPFAGNTPYLCRGESEEEVMPGDVLYNGGGASFFYGEMVTEPMRASGSKAGIIDPESMKDLRDGGRDLWYHVIFYHTICLAIFRRLED